MAAATGAVAVAGLAMPPGVTNTVREDWRRMVGDPGQACFDHQRALLADPASASLATASFSDHDPSVVTIRYRVGKADEATAAVQATCVLRSGKVSEDQTARRREHVLAAERLDKLMSEFDCLDQKKALLRAGKVDRADRLQCRK